MDISEKPPGVRYFAPCLPCPNPDCDSTTMDTAPDGVSRHCYYCGAIFLRAQAEAAYDAGKR